MRLRDDCKAFLLFLTVGVRAQNSGEVTQLSPCIIHSSHKQLARVQNTLRIQRSLQRLENLHDLRAALLVLNCTRSQHFTTRRAARTRTSRRPSILPIPTPCSPARRTASEQRAAAHTARRELTRHSAAHADGAGEHASVQLVQLRHLCRVRGHERHKDVEVAVGGMARDVADEAGLARLHMRRRDEWARGAWQSP